MIEVGELRSTCQSARSRAAASASSSAPHEFDLLRVLAQNRGKLLTHRMLLREVWGPAYQAEAHYLHVYVSHLRRKIEPDPSQAAVRADGARRRLPARRPVGVLRQHLGRRRQA